MLESAVLESTVLESIVLESTVLESTVLESIVLESTVLESITLDPVSVFDEVTLGVGVLDVSGVGAPQLAKSIDKQISTDIKDKILFILRILYHFL